MLQDGEELGHARWVPCDILHVVYNGLGSIIQEHMAMFMEYALGEEDNLQAGSRGLKKRWTSLKGHAGAEALMDINLGSMFKWKDAPHSAMDPSLYGTSLKNQALPLEEYTVCLE